MSGFFPCMMFGVPGAALAMVHCAPKEKQKATIGILASAALCSFVCGITEPFEFAFMFTAPALYVVYAALYGIFSYVTALVGFRAGFAFSAGATDLLFSASLPAAANTWMILPLGAAAFVTFYLVFRVMITRLNLKTPGREDEPSEAAGTVSQMRTDGSGAGQAPSGTVEPLIVDGFNVDGLLQGLGGKDNIQSLDNCITRLRVDVHNYELVDDGILKSSGAKAVIKTGPQSLQVVIGMKVQGVADAMRNR